jgi:KDO2-lipid IV(A) lauroyltransferase
VIAATAHFGNWELLGEVLALRGLPLSAVVRPLEGSVNEVIVENRRKAGMHLIPARGSINGALQALRQGHVVAMLVDQVIAAKHGVFVPFFGRPASTSPGMSIAALRSGAPVYVGMGIREGDGIRLVFEGPIPFPEEGTTEERIQRHTAEVTAVIERYVRQYPEQWLWLHRRWKVQPP